MTKEKKRSLIAKVVEDLFHLGYMHAKTGGPPRARLTCLVPRDGVDVGMERSLLEALVAAETR